MTYFDWQWNPELGGVPESYLAVSLWRELQLADKLTAGGVVSRSLSLAADPLLLFIAPEFLVAVAATSATSAAALASLAPLTAATFIPGDRRGNGYPLSCAGIDVVAAVTSGGVALPADDPRAVILAPSLPTYSESSLVNALADIAADGWLILLDQNTGNVTRYEAANPVAEIMAAIGSAPILAAANALPS